MNDRETGHLLNGLFRVPLHPLQHKTKSFDNKLELPENEPVGETNFHMIGFTQRLILIHRQKATQKLSID